MKVGIISLYTNNSNYGGLLQAYALVSIINRQGYDAEQICFDRTPGMFENHKRKITIRKIAKYSKWKIVNISNNVILKIIKTKIKKRRVNIKLFADNISHSQIYYTEDNISECNQYDVYITGSDQVWNMKWYNKEYFLDFVKDEKYMFSYAASMPNIKLSKEQETVVINYLKRFNEISVREEKSQKYLEVLLRADIEWVLDPTLLLSADEWDTVCSNRLVDGKYIFTYFLGTDKRNRKVAHKFAKKMNLKIVNIPYMTGIFLRDVGYGDIQMYDASPPDFISLIKNAEYVITDSFHAAVFSNIYKVKFFAFGREDMNERLYSLAKLFGNRSRFCDPDIDYIYKMKDKPLFQDMSEFEKIKRQSIDFLKRNLKSGERSIKEI